MSANQDTHIFQSMRSFVAGRRTLASANEKLRENAQKAVFFIGLARAALEQGLIPKAEEYLQTAEKSARGE